MDQDSAFAASCLAAWILAKAPTLERLAMLVLSRKVGERLRIGPDVEIVISRIAGNRVTIGVEAPANVRIVRGELPPEREPAHGPPLPPDDTAPVEVRKSA